MLHDLDVYCAYPSDVAHPDLDGKLLGSIPGYTTTLKLVLTAPRPQPVLVILSLSKTKTLHNGPTDKCGIIQRAGCLIR